MNDNTKSLKPLPKEAHSDGAWMLGHRKYAIDGSDNVEYICYQRFRSNVDAPIEMLPYEAVFIVEFNYPTELGLFDERDEPALYALEELLVKEIEGSELGALFCVHTFLGDREYVFYTQIDLSDRVERILAMAPAGYKIHFESNFDPSWGDLFRLKGIYQE